MDHLHIIWGMASLDARERISRYVELYREHCDEYGFVPGASVASLLSGA